jgi:hypothetical protein
MTRIARINADRADLDGVGIELVLALPGLIRVIRENPWPKKLLI